MVIMAMGAFFVMDLHLKRTSGTATATLGELWVDGAMFCLTVEDAVRLDNPATPADEGAKVYGKTAIPAGRYRITITWSPKFKRDMILVNEVPGFTGIRIHGGVDEEDSLGCPLVGFKRSQAGKLSQTLQASGALRERVRGALDDGEEAWLTVTNDFLGVP